jgi:hypothetical protein
MVVSIGGSGAWKSGGLTAHCDGLKWLWKSARAFVSAEPKMMLELSMEDSRTTSSELGESDLQGE